MGNAINIGMRYREILNEFVISVNGVTVHRNPTPSLVLKTLLDSPHKELRGLVIKDKIYLGFW